MPVQIRLSEYWISGDDGGVAPDCKSGTLETQQVQILPDPLGLRLAAQNRNVMGGWWSSEK